METSIPIDGIDSAVHHLFDEEIRVTEVVEYGISWTEMSAGRAAPPPQGARFDIAFEGAVRGERLNGSFQGVDYLEVRADGRMLMTIYANIVTDDGVRIAVHESGYLTPGPDGIALGQLTMSFLTADPAYDWLNRKQVWGVARIDTVGRTVRIRGYSN